jgi:hypothetical protein
MVSAPRRLEVGARRVRGEPRFARDGRQHRAVADETSLEEIRAEQPLDQFFGIAACLRPRDQPMGVERVRLPVDPVEREIDADRFARGAHARVDPVRAFPPAKFRFEIRTAVDALAGQVRIELERCLSRPGEHGTPERRGRPAHAGAR